MNVGYTAMSWVETILPDDHRITFEPRWSCVRTMVVGPWSRESGDLQLSNGGSSPPVTGFSTSNIVEINNFLIRLVPS